MFNAKQRDRIHEALLNRAEDTNTPRAAARKLRRAANERRIFDRVVEAKCAELLRENPNASDGQILKMLLDFINNGGLESLLKIVATILALFA